MNSRLFNLRTTPSSIGKHYRRPYGKYVIVVNRTIHEFKEVPNESAPYIGCQDVLSGTQIYAPVIRNIPGWVCIVIRGKKLWFKDSHFVDAMPLQVLQTINVTYEKPDTESQTYPCNIAIGMVVFIIGNCVDPRGINWVKLQGHGTWVKKEVVG